MRNPTATSRRTDGVEATGAGRPILVIEDNALIALEHAWALEAAGFVVVGPASTVDEGLALARDIEVAGAVIDIDLGDPDGRTGEEVAVRLGMLDVPVVFVTGRLHATIADHLRTHAFLQKPVDPAALVRVLNASLPAP